MVQGDVMHIQIRKWIKTVLEAHPQVLKIALSQRAKFEGWLKMELAAIAETGGAIGLQLEAPISDAKNASRADMAFTLDDTRYVVELKTPNTNWRLSGVQSKTRPVTKNIQSIVEDAEKLRNCKDIGLVAFTLFPIPFGDRRWEEYVERISSKTGVAILATDCCSTVEVPLINGNKAEVLICCFPV